MQDPATYAGLKLGLWCWSMKKTARSIQAFGACQFVIGLCGPLYGSVFTFDCFAVFLIAAGMAVGDGSRPGRLIAAILSLLYPVVVLASLVPVVLGQNSVPVMWLFIEGAMSLWAIANVVLLICVCDLKSCLPRYSLATLLVVVLLAAVGFKGIRWLLDLGEPPPFATVAAIEEKYKSQLARLRQLAQANPRALGTEAATNNASNVALFGHEEFVSAGYQQISDNSRMVYGEVLVTPAERADWERRSIALHDEAGVDDPVVMMVCAVNDAGQVRQIARYENQVKDTNGRPVLYFLEIDVEMLRQGVGGDGAAATVTNKAAE